MLLSFFLLFSLSASTVKSWNTTILYSATQFTSPRETSSPAPTTEENLLLLQLVATPDYPVAAGQKVHLDCTASTTRKPFSFFLQRLDNLDQIWKSVNNGSHLTLTKPEESGTYRCLAVGMPSQNVSSKHTVYIISMHTTVGEKLGVAAFILSLLALIICLATLVWLNWQRLGDTLTTSNTPANGFPGPEKLQKVGLPKTDCDADVYMNYTSTNQAYTDLDPNNMSGDNVYSSLS